ncbi:MAG: 1-acyl-sn-glycerol-3-phosphate acyltransferase [Spirochaetales bacterium]|nr:1-acyl-sn-glycerol-3-phosphate acyltransferase [Spirochaetales bacterium]
MKRLRPPYLLLVNHACVWDPFMVGVLVPYPIQYVVSDATFRSRLVDFGLSLLGGIPKTKAMSDMDSIKNIMRVKEHGGTIGLFPEGQSTWDGHTLPVLHSTAKLAKLLRIPIVTARIAGSYLSKPRWSKRRRRGRVTIRFDLAFTPEQLKATSAEAIDQRIVELLTHDAFEFNRSAQVKFLGTDRAEYLERALFVCPSCRHIATLHSEGNAFTCTSCGHSVHYTLRGVFRSRNGELKFDNVREWNLWQVEEFKRQLASYVAEAPDSPFLRENDVRVQIGYKSMPLAPFHEGAVELYADRVELHSETDKMAEFPVLDIRGSNVQNNEHWEFYSGADLFKITIGDPRGCTYKWHLAVQLIGDAENKNRSVE